MMEKGIRKRNDEREWRNWNTRKGTWQKSKKMKRERTRDEVWQERNTQEKKAWKRNVIIIGTHTQTRHWKEQKKREETRKLTQTKNKLLRMRLSRKK